MKELLLRNVGQIQNKRKGSHNHNPRNLEKAIGLHIESFAKNKTELDLSSCYWLFFQLCMEIVNKIKLSASLRFCSSNMTAKIK